MTKQKREKGRLAARRRRKNIHERGAWRNIRFVCNRKLFVASANFIIACLPLNSKLHAGKSSYARTGETLAPQRL